MADPRVIRNRAKLEGTVDNAQTLLELDREFRGFRRYLHSHGGFDETVADLKRQFRFLGDTGAYCPFSSLASTSSCASSGPCQQSCAIHESSWARGSWRSPSARLK